MKKKAFFIIIAMATVGTMPCRAMDFDQFFKDTDTFFEKYVIDGGVRYRWIKGEPERLDKLIAFIASADVTGRESKEQLAFYINAYNLYTIKLIVDHYPVSSPMEIIGFFDTKKIVAAEKKTTLNDLENDRIRKFNDPRIHFALVCAARGCPKIADHGYNPQHLDEQLTKQARLSLNDPAFIRIDGTKVKISEIFKWYRRDFGKTDADLISFINKYRDTPLPEKARLSYYTYDWSLNEASH